MRAIATTQVVRLATASIALCGMLTFVACGGDDPPSQSGDATIPAGFKSYRGKLVSFAYPGDWKVEERTTPSGSTILVQPTSGSPPQPTIRLNEDPDLGGTFDAVLKVQTGIRKGTGEIDEKTEDVDVEGAERAVRREGATTIDGQPFDSAGLAVLTKAGGGAFLSAVIPRAEGQPEIDGIIDSLRLNDG